MSGICRWLGAVLFAVAATAVLPAQQPGRDPTVPSPKMRERMAEAPPTTAAAQRIPTIVLKGRVIAHNRPAAALVEIDGRVITVTPDLTVVVGGTQTLKFVEVSAAGVKIEINAPKQTIHLN